MNKPYAIPAHHDMKVRGFTLIELMVVVVIISILATIALPSYRRYATLNAEREVQAKMLQLQIELERWRASSLTYKGFQPQIIATNSNVTYGYSATDNKTIYVPDGSNASNYRYQITLVDGVDTAKSLVTTGTTVDSSTGRSWKMRAIPNTTGVAKGGNNMLLSSSGIKCQSKDSAVTIASANCGIGQEEW